MLYPRFTQRHLAVVVCCCLIIMLGMSILFLVYSVYWRRTSPLLSESLEMILPNLSSSSSASKEEDRNNTNHTPIQFLNELSKNNIIEGRGSIEMIHIKNTETTASLTTPQSNESIGHPPIPWKNESMFYDAIYIDDYERNNKNLFADEKFRSGPNTMIDEKIFVSDLAHTTPDFLSSSSSSSSSSSGRVTKQPPESKASSQQPFIVNSSMRRRAKPRHDDDENILNFYAATYDTSREKLETSFGITEDDEDFDDISTYGGSGSGNYDIPKIITDFSKGLTDYDEKVRYTPRKRKPNRQSTSNKSSNKLKIYLPNSFDDSNKSFKSKAPRRRIARPFKGKKIVRPIRKQSDDEGLMIKTTGKMELDSSTNRNTRQNKHKNDNTNYDQQQILKSLIRHGEREREKIAAKNVGRIRFVDDLDSSTSHGSWVDTRTRRVLGNVQRSEERSRQLLLCEEAGGGELCRMLFKGPSNE